MMKNIIDAKPSLLKRTKYCGLIRTSKHVYCLLGSYEVYVSMYKSAKKTSVSLDSGVVMSLKLLAP